MGKTKQKVIPTEIKKRKWKWRGHTSNITRTALEWNPRETRKKGHPRTTWQWTVLNELKPEKKTWAEVKALAVNRTRWRTFTRAPCSTEE
jgi:hypothetical protein